MNCTHTGHSRLLALSLALLFFRMPATAAATEAGALRLSFSAAADASNTLGASEYPVLAYDGAHVYVAWEETYDNLLMLSRSDDDGATFGLPGAFVPAEGLSFQQADATTLGDGDVHLSFTAFDVYSGGAEIAHAGSTDAAQSFPQLAIVSSIDEMNSYASSIAGGWALAIAWSNVHVWTGQSSVEIALSTDGGSEFSVPKQVDDAALDAERCPSVALGAEGSVFVAWTARYQPITGAATEDIYFTRSTDSGAAFEIPMNLSGEPYEISWCPHVAADASGGVYVLWVEGVLNDKRLMLAVSHDGAATFSAPRVLVGPIDDVDAYMATSPDAAVWITWMTSDFGGAGIEHLVTRSLDGGETFAPPAVVSSSSTLPTSPRLAAASRDRVFLAWSAIPDNPEPGSGSDIYVTRAEVRTCGDANDDGTVTAVDALSALRTAVGTASCPACRCDVDGSANVSTSDALSLLRLAVGQDVEIQCQPC